MKDFPIIPAGKLSISMRKPVYGVGINDAQYKIKPKVGGKRIECPYYRRWLNMLERCYDARLKERCPTYVGCYVSDEWLLFSNFRAWMCKQDWVGLYLDKDILVSYNKN